jgi:WD40 repeat protein
MFILLKVILNIFESKELQELSIFFRFVKPTSLSTFKQHQGSVNKVAWSPHNSELFASCSDDCSVIIWNTEVNNELFIFLFF